MISKLTNVESAYEIPYVLWDKIVPLLPPPKRKKKKAGRPRMNDRKAMSAIFYVLRTACQWKALLRSLGASSTVHDRFQEWRKAGIFKRMWIDGLSLYDKKTGIDWKWQSMDAVITKAPMEGITNIAKTVSANQDEEEVWMELIFYKDRKHGDEVGANMQNDENMERLYKQSVDLLSPGTSFVMGEFNRLRK